MKKIGLIALIIAASYFAANKRTKDIDAEIDDSASITTESDHNVINQQTKSKLANDHSKDQDRDQEVGSKNSQSQHHHEKKLVSNKKIEEIIQSIDNTDSNDYTINTFDLLKKQNLSNFKMMKFIESLKDSGMEVASYLNGDSGMNDEMYLLKNTKAIPGLRYFHGQVFKQDGKERLQHLSFEYPKGENSFNQAVSVVYENFVDKETPSVLTDEYALWELKSGHIVWVKKQSKEEVLENPIYPHDENDAGTIKIAIEEEIH